MNKKGIIGTILVALIISTVYYFSNKKEAITTEGNEIVKIGVILPLTGNYAKIGNDIKIAIEQSYKDAISAGIVSKYDVELEFEDNQLDATKTISAYNKLKSSGNLIAVTTVTSKCLLALKPITNKDKVILLNGSAVSPEINEGNDYCFSVIPDAKLEAEFLANYITKELNLLKLNSIYRNDQSGINFNKFFSESVEKNGGEIISVNSHEPNSSEFRTLISKLKTKHGQGLFLGSFGNETANFAKQCLELSLNVPIFTYETINQPNAIDIGGNALNNVQFVSPKIDYSSKIVMEFTENIKKDDNTQGVNYYMLSHYDGIKLILESIGDVGKSTTKIKDKLETIKQYNGIGPGFSFNENGGAIVELEILGFENGEVINKSN